MIVVFKTGSQPVKMFFTRKGKKKYTKKDALSCKIVAMQQILHTMHQ